MLITYLVNCGYFIVIRNTWKAKVMEREKRNINLDLIRSVAVLNVIGVHFFLNSGFYGEQILGKKMLILCIGRSMFMTWVPLFLLLSGYLMTNKTLSVQYYKGIWKTLIIYLLASVACIIYRNIVYFDPIGFFRNYPFLYF